MLDVGVEPIGSAFTMGGPDQITRVLVLNGATVPSDITCTIARRFASPATAVSGDPSAETIWCPLTVRGTEAGVEELQAAATEPIRNTENARRFMVPWASHEACPWDAERNVGSIGMRFCASTASSETNSETGGPERLA
jgi:hypothetical protein